MERRRRRGRTCAAKEGNGNGVHHHVDEHEEEEEEEEGEWRVRQPGQKDGEDYLVALGKGSNTNTEVGARRGNVDDLFIGTGRNGAFVLGQDSDIANGDLRYTELRSFENIVDGYYIAPSFMDAVVMHAVKNVLADQGSLGKLKPPLIMGIWGEKGQGKSFQLELCCKRLGMTPIVTSAGELESDVAGEPGRLIRDRYRAAAQSMRTNGKLACLIINDLDAGVGRFARTQHTVNSQIVMASLMNICDHPNKVPVFGGVFREKDWVPRTPIFITMNDASTLYAPLIRDGRMEKFYWAPSTTDLINILMNIFEKDGVSEAMAAELVREFRGQPLDFFGALRSRLADGAVRTWAVETVGNLSNFTAGSRDDFAPLHTKLIGSETKASVEIPSFSLDEMICAGRALVEEQKAVEREKLAAEYMRLEENNVGIGIGLLG